MLVTRRIESDIARDCIKLLKENKIESLNECVKILEENCDEQLSFKVCSNYMLNIWIEVTYFNTGGSANEMQCESYVETNPKWKHVSSLDFSLENTIKLSLDNESTEKTVLIVLDFDWREFHEHSVKTNIHQEHISEAMREYGDSFSDDGMYKCIRLATQDCSYTESTTVLQFLGELIICDCFYIHKTQDTKEGIELFKAMINTLDSMKDIQQFSHDVWEEYQIYYDID